MCFVLRYLAIDETDRMSEKGHFAELEKILEMISSTESKIQRFVMSATLSIVHKAPFYKKGKFVFKVKRIIESISINQDILLL